MCLQKPRKDTAQIGISNSACARWTRNRVWTAIRKGSGLVVNERTDLSWVANEDVFATAIRRRGANIMRIVNVYNQNDVDWQERVIPLRMLICQTVIRLSGNVLAGDINAHRKGLDPRCNVQRNAAFWENVNDENEQEIGNDDRLTYLWTKEDQEGDSVIKLTFGNQPIVIGTLLADDHSTGSDYEFIAWEVGVASQQEEDHERVVGWHLAAMKRKEAEVVDKLWMELAKEIAQLDTACTEDKVEREATWFQNAMSSILDPMAEKIRICTTSKRWWNAAIKDRRSTVWREQRKGWNSE